MKIDKAPDEAREDAPALPDWLESRALGDTAMGLAYESLDARCRAVLKTCIARLHRIWGESPELESSRRCPARGFCLEREERPAETAVILCAAGYRHPAAFLAAIMPAVLAGVRTVLPFFTLPPAARVSRETAGRDGADPDERLLRNSLPEASLLAALELAGVERAYLLAEGEALSFLRELRPEKSRLLLLGEKPFALNLILYAHSAGLACRSFLRPPRYWSERLGKAELPHFFPGQAGSGQEGAERSGEPPELCLDAAHEGLWLWPDLEPGWFRLRRARLFAL